MNPAARPCCSSSRTPGRACSCATHGVVMENGRVRLAGTGREVLEHPEIGALYLGGTSRNARRAAHPNAGRTVR